jgi:hypothetical protein
MPRRVQLADGRTSGRFQRTATGADAAWLAWHGTRKEGNFATVNPHPGRANNESQRASASRFSGVSQDGGSQCLSQIELHMLISSFALALPSTPLQSLTCHRTFRSIKHHRGNWQSPSCKFPPAWHTAGEGGRERALRWAAELVSTAYSARSLARIETSLTSRNGTGSRSTRSSSSATLPAACAQDAKLEAYLGFLVRGVTLSRRRTWTLHGHVMLRPVTCTVTKQ